MSLGYAQSAQGHGWETLIGDTAYWFGRGRSGRLLGGFVSVVDLLDAFDGETAVSGVRFELATDRLMTAEPSHDGVYVLRIAGAIVGYFKPA